LSGQRRRAPWHDRAVRPRHRDVAAERPASLASARATRRRCCRPVRSWSLGGGFSSKESRSAHRGPRVYSPPPNLERGQDDTRPRLAFRPKLLPNGKVLVAGGWARVAASRTATCTNPFSRSWSPTGSDGHGSLPSHGVAPFRREGAGCRRERSARRGLDAAELYRSDLGAGAPRRQCRRPAPVTPATALPAGSACGGSYARAADAGRALRTRYRSVDPHRAVCRSRVAITPPTLLRDGRVLAVGSSNARVGRSTIRSPG